MILRQRVAWGKLYYDLRYVYCSDFRKIGQIYGHNFNQTLYKSCFPPMILGQLLHFSGVVLVATGAGYTVYARSLSLL